MPADLPFTVSATTADIDHGELVTAFLQSPESTGLVVPSPQSSSIGGSTTVRRTGKGAWTFSLPHLDAAGPQTFVATALGGAAAVCRVASSKTVSGGAVQEVSVRCRGPLGKGPVDTKVQLAYARDNNALGASDVSTAYAFVARSTAPVRLLPSTAVRNVVGGRVHDVLVTRSGAGRYRVDLRGQAGGARQTAAITPVGSTASCSVTSSTSGPRSSQLLDVACESPFGVLVDSAFHLQYTNGL